MWVVERTGSCPKYGSAPANSPTAVDLRRELTAAGRTEAEACEQLRRLQEWAAAGVGQSYHAAMKPTYAVRPAGLAPASPPAGQTDPRQQPSRGGGSP